jgi:hypothetical protein
MRSSKVHPSTDASGRHYLIVRVDDPLFAGNPRVEPGDGFDDYLRQLTEAEDRMVAASAAFGGGAIGGILAQFALCVPTMGATCITAMVTALGTGAGGAAGFFYYLVADFQPAYANPVAQFHEIDLQRP